MSSVYLLVGQVIYSRSEVVEFHQVLLLILLSSVKTGRGQHLLDSNQQAKVWVGPWGWVF